MAIRVGDVNIRITVDDKDVKKNLDKAERQVEGFAKVANGFMERIGHRAFDALERGATQAARAIVGFAQESVSTFVSLQNSMNEVFTLLPGISKQAMDAMTDQVMEFSKEFGALPEKVIPALYQALSAGVPQNNVFDFLATAQMAAVGGVTDLETAVDGISSVMNAYGAEVISAAKASDIMFTTMRLGKTTIDELSRFLFQVIPVAAALSIPFEEVGAAIAVITAQGTPTQVATTQIRQLFVELSKSGSQAAKIFQELTGKTLKEFVAEGNNIQDVLQVMESAAAVANLSIADLFGSVEAGQAALQLTGSATEKLTSALAELNNVNGATGEAFMLMDEGIQRSIDRMDAAKVSFLSAFGEALAPAVQMLVDLATRAFSYGERFIDEYAAGIIRGIAYVVNALTLLAQVIGHWLKPGSPPRILPKLTEWGRDAATEYIKGWANPDFRSFAELGRSIENVLRSYVGTRQIRQVDLVQLVFGGRNAIAKAVSEFRQLGSVSSTTIAEIVRATGPAGQAIGGLVKTFFDLERASRRVSQAQEELNKVTRRYDDIISPLNEKLTGIQDQQSALRDQQRIASLRQDIASEDVAASDKKLAQMEIEEIQLRSQIRARERERDAAVDAAKDKISIAEEEERQAQEAFDLQNQLFEQQLEQNRLIGEEIALQEQLAEARRRAAEAADAKAQQEAEKAMRESKRAAEEMSRKLEALYQAQLNYNLATADTPGKIALMKLELMRYTEGSEEYFNILTKIVGLEAQLEREREAAARGGGSTSILDQIIAAKDGISALKSASDDALGIMQNAADLPTTMEDLFSTTTEKISPLVSAMEELAAAQERFMSMASGDMELPEWIQETITAVKDLAESLKILTGAFGDTDEEIARSRQSQILEIKAWAAVFRGDWAEALGYWKDQFFLNAEGVEEKNKLTLAGIQERSKNFYPSFAGGWARHWAEQQATAKTNMDGTVKSVETGLDDIETDLRSRQEPFRAAGSGLTLNLWKGITGTWDIQFPWLSSALQAFKDMLPGSEPKNTSSPLYNLKKSGSAIIDNLWSGLKTKWTELAAWWTEKMSWIRNQLPFSEPKDPSSPLRGLDKAGESIVKQINDGMAKARFNVTPTLSAAFAGAASNVTNHNYYFDQTFGNVNSDVGGARQASRDGIRDAMRARGLS